MREKYLLQGYEVLDTMQSVRIAVKLSDLSITNACYSLPQIRMTYRFPNNAPNFLWVQNVE